MNKPEWCNSSIGWCHGFEDVRGCEGCSFFVKDYEFKELEPNKDMVEHPDHYKDFPVEVIEMIKAILTMKYGEDGFEAYCFGNEIKYRMRAGLKADTLEDISKSMKYAEFRKEG